MVKIEQRQTVIGFGRELRRTAFPSWDDHQEEPVALRCLAPVNALTDSKLKSPQMTEDAKAKDYTVDVFISYRRADVGFADRLYKLFAARRLSVWYDALIAPGADWRDAIVQHLEKAKLMVIVLSAHSLGSKELKKELAVADLEDVPLLAIRLERSDPANLSLMSWPAGTGSTSSQTPKRNWQSWSITLRYSAKTKAGSERS
jgi:hypothetical protein